MNKDLYSILEVLEQDSSGRNDTLVHLRVIRNMLDYEIQSSDELFSRNDKSEKDYREINFLRTLLDYMNKELQSLMVIETQNNSILFRESFQKAQRRERVGLVVLIMLVLFLSSVTLLSMRRILSRMGILISSAHSFYQGELRNAEIPLSEFSELNELSQAFNKMNHDIHEYIRQIEEKSRLEVELKDQHLENERKNKMLQQARLDFLHSQINPHFLFNALNAVGKHSVLNNPEISLELIEAISRILRYSLDHHSEMVPVSEELKTLESYLRIQKVRYEDRLSYSISASADVQQFTIPAMIVQPIVENAVIYGLAADKKILTVNIDMCLEEGELLIRVDDNGPGISADILDSIQSSGGIGLANVRDRLDLSYGEEEHLIINTEAGKGTSVVISIPVER